MRRTKATGNRMLTLIFPNTADVDYLNAAAAWIRELPRVERVRLDLDARELEVLHKLPNDGLLQEIHSTLLCATIDTAARKGSELQRQS